MLSLHIILSMILFSSAMSVTPGPVNTVIITSGINYGFYRTMPFISGATIGFTLLLITVGYGLHKLLIDNPNIFLVLSWCGALFIVYLGLKIIMLKPSLDESEKQQQTPKFMHGFMLQWLNPKAWMACISGVAMFSSPYSGRPLMVFIIIYFLICYLGLSIWGYAGEKAAKFLKTGGRMKTFNIIMGVFLIFSAVSIILS